MKKQLLALAMAGAMLLGGCQPTYNENDPNYPGTTQPEQNDTHGDTENKDNQYDSDYGVTGDENLGNENNNVPTARARCCTIRPTASMMPSSSRRTATRCT